MRNITASDRSILLRLASGLPVGSSERRAIVSGLAKIAESSWYDRVRVENEDGVITWVKKDSIKENPGKYKPIEDSEVGDDDGEDKPSGNSKSKLKREYKKNKDGTYTDEKYGVRLDKGVKRDRWEAFLDDPEGKDLLENFKIDVIAGRDGVVTPERLENAVRVRQKMREYAEAKKKAKETGSKAKFDDICDKDTFPADVCGGNLGIRRDSMPQFTQKPINQMLKAMSDKRYKEIKDHLAKGGKLDDLVEKSDLGAYFDKDNAESAVKAGADPNSNKSVFDSWVDHLKKGGTKITDLRDVNNPDAISVKDLKATQSEINADKAVENSAKFLAGKVDLKNPKEDEVIYVSSDGHILDGHHRWSGLLLANPDTKIPVIKIDRPMRDLLEDSHNFPGVFRQNVKFEVAAEDDPVDLARKPGDVWKQRNGKYYGKKADGDIGGPYKTQASAKNYASGKGNKKKDEEKKDDDKGKGKKANLSSHDRVILVRVAAKLPVGSAERRAILSGISRV